MPNDDIARLRALVEDTKTGTWSRSGGHVLIEESDDWPSFDINLLPGKHRPVAVALARYIAAVNPPAIRALLDELEKARADAERYRWLRDHGEWEAFDTVWLHEQNLYGQGPADMDAAIDQARAAQQGE